MARRTSKRKRHGSGFITREPSGSHRAEVNCGYKRYRRCFKSEPEARAWIDSVTAEVSRNAAPLDTATLAEARRALELLPPGVGLVEAARHYLRTGAPAVTLTLDEAMKLFLADKATAGLRPRALSSLTGQCRRLAEQLGHRGLSDISTDHLTAWLDNRGHTGLTRRNYRRAWCALWNWLIAHDHAVSNPAIGITVPRIDEAIPGILTVDQAAALMAHLEVHGPPHVTAYAALGLFAGLRPQEAIRLHWDAVNDEHVLIGPSVAKTRQQRLVTIQPVLARWVALTRSEGRVCPVSVRNGFEAARRAAGIDPWPSDALRHSFGTYHLAMWKDAAATAHEMGHHGTDMLYRHYRALATPSDARQYWDICPEFAQKNA